MSLNFTQGDTAPNLDGVIHLEEAPETTTDLTDCAVRFQMRKPEDRRYQVNALATVVDAPLGTVSYEWGPNDLAVPGTYLAQFEITYLGGRVQTTYPPVELNVRRQ